MSIKLKPGDRIAIDIDGVLANTLPHLVDFCNQRLNKNVSIKEVGEKGFGEAYNISVPEYLKLLHTFFTDVEKGIRAMQPYSEAQEAIEKLSKKYELIVITNRPGKVVGAITEEWLDEHFPQIEKVIFNRDRVTKERYSKLDAVKSAGCKILIDDNPFVPGADDDVSVLVYDTIHNRHINGDSVFRVRNWKEIVKLLL